MAIEIRLFPCLKDNYAILLRDKATGLLATIDSPDAEVILKAVDELGGSLSLILNTHWHKDHTGGNQALKAATGAMIYGPQEISGHAPLDQKIGEDDKITLGHTQLRVLETPGHTLGHLSYYSEEDKAVFVGDTLFVLGCGRLFEGSPETMWKSLAKLMALPNETRVYCAHEYTADNARFTLEQDNSPLVVSHCQALLAARSQAQATVPTTIEEEKLNNPFLRARLLAHNQGLNLNAVQAFARMRDMKNHWRG